jgi:tetratricopeptide (TPR) repeat protein
MKLRVSPPLVLPVFIILGFIIYFPALRAPFFFDDYEFILNNPLAQDAAFLFSHWHLAGLKFFTYVTFVCNFIVGGPYTLGYHLVNIILHIYNVWLVSVLAEKFLQTPQISRLFTQQQKEAISVLSALLFLVHPVATSAVTYIWQRAELLNAAFYLSALIYYIMARQEKKFRYYVAVALCFILGMFVKGTIISLPLMIVVLECALWPTSRKKAYGIILFFGGIFFLKAFLYLWEEPWGIYSNWIMNPLMQLTGTMLIIQYFWTQLFVTVKYFGLALFPVSQNFDYGIALAGSFWEPRVWSSALILVGLLVLAVICWKHRRLFSVGILWFFICLMPAALLAGRESMWEYRMYLPLSGLLIGVVAGLVSVFDLRKVSWGMIAVAVVFSALTFSRNVLWQSPEQLLLDNIRKSPQSANAYQLLGTLYLQDGRVDEAQTYLEKAISLAPDAAESYNNLGLIAKNRGDIPHAQKMFEAAISNRPTLTGAYINLAYLLLGQGDEEKAEDLLRQSLQVKETEGAYAALGKLSLSRGKWDEAEKFLLQSLRINPQASQAYFWYGELWLARQNSQKAQEMFRQAVRFNPALSGVVPIGF